MAHAIQHELMPPPPPEMKRLSTLQFRGHHNPEFQAAGVEVSGLGHEVLTLSRIFQARLAWGLCFLHPFLTLLERIPADPRLR